MYVLLRFDVLQLRFPQVRSQDNLRPTKATFPLRQS